MFRLLMLVALSLLLVVPAAQAKTLDELEGQQRWLLASQSDTERQLREKRRIHDGNERLLEKKKAELRQINETGSSITKAMVGKQFEREIELIELTQDAIAHDIQNLEDQLGDFDRQIKSQERKIVAFGEEQERREAEARRQAAKEQRRAEAAARDAWWWNVKAALAGVGLVAVVGVGTVFLSPRGRRWREERRAWREEALASVVYGGTGPMRAVRPWGEFARASYWMTRTALMLFLFSLVYTTSGEVWRGLLQALPAIVREPIAASANWFADQVRKPEGGTEDDDGVEQNG